MASVKLALESAKLSPARRADTSDTATLKTRRSTIRFGSESGRGPQLPPSHKKFSTNPVDNFVDEIV